MYKLISYDMRREERVHVKKELEILTVEADTIYTEGFWVKYFYAGYPGSDGKVINTFCCRLKDVKYWKRVNTEKKGKCKK